MAIHPNLTVKVTRAIKDIPMQDWNMAFLPVLENYYFFKALDESNFEQFSFFYIIVYKDGVPVGATSCFNMRFSLDMTVNGFLRHVFSAAKKIVPNILSPRVLICGLPMGQGRIGITDDSSAVMEAIRDSVEHLAQEEKAAMIIFKDFTSVYENSFKPFLKLGYFKIESIPSTEMQINFASFEEYLKALSRASREGLKRNLKKTDSQVKIDFQAKDKLDEEELSQVHELYLQTYKKQDIGLEKLPIEFFRSVSRNMPHEVKYFLWKIDSKIAAFAFCLFKGDYFIDYYLGFDYTISHKYNLYSVRFRDLLKWCIEHGIKKYEMGVTSYEVKRRLGFNFIRLYFYMKHRNPIINKCIPFLKFLFAPEYFDPVFKEMNADVE
ncbi:MAG: GNAT family N-acetyltransferase [Candidatus Omnitrophica bacterium]|nr:GNAT family N-acetyltransferase [Candidatus Omnitrophota bacterium]